MAKILRPYGSCVSPQLPMALASLKAHSHHESIQGLYSSHQDSCTPSSFLQILYGPLRESSSPDQIPCGEDIQSASQEIQPGPQPWNSWGLKNSYKVHELPKGSSTSVFGTFEMISSGLQIIYHLSSPVLDTALQWLAEAWLIFWLGIWSSEASSEAGESN